MTWDHDEMLAAELADVRANARRRRYPEKAPAPLTDETIPPPEPVEGPTIDRLRAACGDIHSAAFDVDAHLANVAKAVDSRRG